MMFLLQSRTDWRLAESNTYTVHSWPTKIMSAQSRGKRGRELQMKSRNNRMGDRGGKGNREKLKRMGRGSERGCWLSLFCI